MMNVLGEAEEEKGGIRGKSPVEEKGSLVGPPSSVMRIEHYTIVSICGRVGFFFKAFIYTFIGALIAQAAFADTIKNNASPQGVLVFLGSAPNGSGYFYLSVMLLGILIYALWRFWEGLTGQGYHDEYSESKNFFKFRVSPLASGSVYLAYAAYIITLLSKDPAPLGTTKNPKDSSCFPVCWRNNIIGNIGLGLLATAFTIATLTQLVPAFTGNFYKELDFSLFLKGRLRKGVKYPMLLAGHIGFFGRACLFSLVCFLFWQILLGDELILDETEATVGQAVNNVREYKWGRSIMALLGLSLILYGAFAFLCIYFKIFPTRGHQDPSRGDPRGDPPERGSYREQD
jgi:hypothetical protein